MNTLKQLVYLILLCTTINTAEYTLHVREWGVIALENGNSVLKDILPDNTAATAKKEKYPLPLSRNDSLKLKTISQSLEKLSHAMAKPTLSESEKKALQDQRRALLLEYIQIKRKGRKPPVAKEPVLYFDHQGLENLSVEVTFAAGVPLVTYPKAHIKGSTLRWPLVRLKNCDKNHVTSCNYPDTLARELEIINTNDNSLLQVQSETAKALFYEGTLSFDNRVTVSRSGKAVTIYNNTAHTVYDLYSFHEQYAVAPNKLYSYCYIDSLSSGDSITCTLTRCKITRFSKKVPFIHTLTPTLTTCLKTQGFRTKEAEAFNRIWSTEIFSTSGSSLLYRLPQDETEKILPITINPKPTSITRALYIFTH